MNIFIDTSSLVKLYHVESGTNELDEFFKNNSIQSIFLSNISKVEFESAFWKKVRMQELSIQGTKETIDFFRSDYSKYNFIPIENDLIQYAQDLLHQHGHRGLRSLDAIQLASILAVSDKISTVMTSDAVLRAILNDEGISTI